MALRIEYIVALLLLGSSCADPKEPSPVPVDLLIDAELDLRPEIDRLTINDGEYEPKPYQNGAGAEGWPLALQIEPVSGLSRAGVVVRAFSGDKELVRRSIDLRLDAKKQRRALTVYLTQSCRSVFEMCDERSVGTCLPCESTCGGDEVLQSSLPEVESADEPLAALQIERCSAADMDASVDAGPDATVHEAGMDASRDAQVDAEAGADADAGDADVTPALPALEPLAVSSTHACAIRGANRTAYCFGLNDHGQLGISGEPSSLLTPVQVGAGATPLTQVRQLAVGTSFSCALNDDGRVRCWGTTERYQTGTRRVSLADKPYPVVLAEGGTAPEYLPLEDIIQIAAADRHACAVSAQGTLYCWGSNEGGRLGVGSSATSSDGAVPVPLPDEQKAKLVGVSAGATCVVTQDQRLYCWGDNRTGTAGLMPESTDGTVIVNGDVLLPNELVLDPDATPVVKVRGGDRHFALFADNGSVWTWGSNAYGQLRRTSGSCESGWANGMCAATPGAASFPNAQRVLELATSDSQTCAVIGLSKEVSCNELYVVRAEGEPGVRLGPVEHLAGASSSNASCLLTTLGEIYCHGSFLRPSDFMYQAISTFGSALKISFPE